MSSSYQSEPGTPRPPRAVGLACLFDLFVATVLGLGVAGAGCQRPEFGQEVLLLCVPLLALAGLFFAMACSLRRLCAWVWVSQLIALCLVIGILPVPGLVLVPLLVAWCGPGVRDWFDPPAYREFG